MAKPIFNIQPTFQYYPEAYKNGVTYSQIPNLDAQDFVKSDTASARYRMNKDGVYENICSSGTSMPRLDYKLNSKGNPAPCPDLFVEKSKTNYLPFSVDLNGGPWASSGVSRVSDVGISPEGLQTCDVIKASGAAGFHYVEGQISGVNNGMYVWSCFVKEQRRQWIKLYMDNDGGGAPADPSDVFFNLGTGEAGDKSGSIVDSGIEKYPNGWFRVWMRWEKTGPTNQIKVRLYIADGASAGDDNFTGQNYDDIWYWGGQVEDDYLHSYIPTPAAVSVTNPDEHYETTGTSGLFNRWAGMMFADFSIENQIVGSASTFSICDGSNNNGIYVSQQAGLPFNMNFSIKAGGVSQMFHSEVIDSFGRYKIAVSWSDTNKYLAYINGVMVKEDLFGNPFVNELTQCCLHNGSNVNDFEGRFHDWRVYPNPNAVQDDIKEFLQSITTI